jgi:hypothetical protein
MTNLALATDNTQETADTDALVYILGYAKKENARVYDIWGVYTTRESALTAQAMLNRNRMVTRITETTLYE